MYHLQARPCIFQPRNAWKKNTVWGSEGVKYGQQSFSEVLSCGLHSIIPATCVHVHVVVAVILSINLSL